MMLMKTPPGRIVRYSVAGFFAGAIAPAISALPLLWSDLADGEVFDILSSWPHLILAGLPIAGALLAGNFGYFEQRLRGQISELEHGRSDDLLLACRDPLTGLGNRVALQDSLRSILGSEKRSDHALLLIDIDRFKFVNDTMGQDAGDHLLVQVSRRLRRAVGEDALIFRLGGDEFAVILPKASSKAIAEFFCLEIEGSLSQAFQLQQKRVFAGVSIGATLLLASDDDLSLVIKRANLALDRAKQRFGASHAFYDQALAQEAIETLELERDLAQALSEGEFYLEYQPIVGVKNGQVRSLEALLRWQHPTRGLVAPDVFIPIAERIGIILDIGRWVVQQACQEAARWPAPTGVSVNVSGDQFKDPGFVAHVFDSLAEAGLSPERLTVEVTESVFSVELELVCRSLAQLRSGGVRIALDDFGTGFASIHHLRKFPLDELKIDRSFAQQMVETSQGAMLVDLMHKLSETFQVKTTIEGIETARQLEFVRVLGIGEAQGFLFSRPFGAGEVLGYLQSRLGAGTSALPVH
ncbi:MULTISPECIES: putative bifunctional diguanylate cyclase/phosphodiesterase [unclassified Rhizobium]|uniref:putative bifunctional diguanylate cyclase/phosphodiesterase n=1 Tax=unclassified Rhizobium TaxID=2613769 RepID=UPI0009E69473|nr:MULTISPECIES: EAL domain-containing protein [unclassified Rhizobium]